MFFLVSAPCSAPIKGCVVRDLMAKFLEHNDFADQSTKLGIVDPYDVLSNFRRDAT